MWTEFFNGNVHAFGAGWLLLACFAIPTLATTLEGGTDRPRSPGFMNRVSGVRDNHVIVRGTENSIIRFVPYSPKASRNSRLALEPFL